MIGVLIGAFAVALIDFASARFAWDFGLFLALMGLVLFVRVVESVELAWCATRGKVWSSFGSPCWRRVSSQVEFSTPLPVDEIRTQLSALLTQRGYWSAEVPDLRGAGMVAGRRRAVLWAQPLGYGVLLLALVGLAIAGSWGWQGEQWPPLPGESQAVGRGTPYAIRLDDFQMSSGDDQRLKDYHSRVTWVEDDVELEQARVGVGQPATHEGLSVRQLGYVPVVRIRGWDDDGRPLALETGAGAVELPGEATIRFSSEADRPLILVPGHDLFLALTFEPLCANGRPALLLNRIQGDGSEEQVLEVLHESGWVSVDGLQLDVNLEFVPILVVSFRPLTGFLVASMALVVMALFLMWMVPPRLARFAVEQGKESLTSVHISAPGGAGTEPWLAQLTEGLREALSDDI
jgi:hypothetical protein